MQVKHMFFGGVFMAFATASLHADQVTPKIADALQPVPLGQKELSGEIGRRIDDLIYKHYMVLDLDRDFIEPFLSRPFTNEAHYVGVGKVIDAGSLFTAYTGDPKIADRTSRLIEGLMHTRDADGYIGTFKPEPGGTQNHQNWVLHEQEYLLLGLVRNWHMTGNRTSLESARGLGDYMIKLFSKDTKPEEVCTAGLPEAFLALYRATGDKRYLDFAANVRHGSKWEVQCASLRDWQQTFETKPAHVYVMTARCYAQTELYRLDPAPQLLNMSRYMRHELLREDGGGLTVIGSASDGEHFSYTQNGKGAISESCVTAYLIRWLDSLMRLEGDLRYGDVMERTVYNALFAAQAPDGRRLRYFTPFEGPREYYGGDGFCCPGNYRRIVAELPQKIYYRFGENGIAVNFYTPSKKEIELGKGLSVTVEQQTDYPSSGHVTIRVSPSQPTAFPLRLRIPRWCPKATLAINAEAPVSVAPGTQPCELSRTWKAGDAVTLDLPMPWRLIKGRKLQEGKAALMRGPVTFCIGTAQNAEALKKYPDLGVLIIDPATLGEPVLDTSVRQDGRMVKVQARPPEANADPVTLTLTEFVDPSGVATYFRIPDLAKACDDELMSDCFAK